MWSRTAQTDIEKQLLLTVWTLANLETFRSISERFGVSKSTAVHSFYKVIDALMHISHEIIVWPKQNEVREITQAFARTANFPDVLGAIDGTHIPITAPKEHAAKYINRKGFHSVLLQAVCNPKLEFIDYFTGGPGCMHDSRMLRKSPLIQKILQNPNEVFYGNTHY